MWRWTFPSISVLTLSILCSCTGQFVVVAPNLVRTDTVEHIFLQAPKGYGSIPVTIKMTDFNTEVTLTQNFVTLNQDNNYHALISTQVLSTHLRREEKQHKYVNLEVAFGNLHTEKRTIMVSFHAGYIFIQTDKPIYNPEDTVLIRLFVSSPTFKTSDMNAVHVDIKNPEGVVVDHRSNRMPKNGIVVMSYALPRSVLEGKWTVVARFDHWPQNNFQTTFEVKKFVLPAFSVTLTPEKSFLDVTDTNLRVDIRARYLYGEPALGTAYVVYGLKKGKEMMRAPKVKQVDMQQDGGILTLNVSEITQACEVQSGKQQSDCSIQSLVDSYVYIRASVLTESGGDLVEVEKSNIKIVSSPYVLAFKDMQKYYKPGLPFHFTIYVTYHDGTPAHKVPLSVSHYDNPLTSSYGTVGVSINMPNEASPQTITVTTNHLSLSADRQATKALTVHPYRATNPNRPNYLYIHSRSHKVELRVLTLEMSIRSDQKSSITEITYLILSKGKILEAQRVAVTHQQIISVTTTVTPEMMPSFRFVAFYILGTEVVSDSIKLEVSETCANPPKISARESYLEYRPESTLRLKIQAEPQTTISLVAVDQAVYQLSKNHFTQKHIVGEVDSRDFGCTDGSGKNAMGVFSDAGLLFAMKNGPSTESRQDLMCLVNARRRRSAALMELQTLLSPEGDEDEEEEYDIDEFQLRGKFPDTWLWMDYSVPDQAALDGLGTLQIDQPIPDSITQWSIVAVSSSKKTGFCVTEPWTFVVKKPFFVDLKLPLSVARNEQVEIKAVVYNYRDETLDVSVVLQRTRDMCSVAFKRQHKLKIKVRPGSSAVVPYTIVPLKAGKIPIQVAAYTTFFQVDRVEKFLNVVVEGVQKTESVIIHLNPSDYPDNRQMVQARKPVLKGVVPNTEPVTKITFSGNMSADTIHKATRDDELARLIQMPSGYVEGNLASMTFPLIATLYLERTKGWETVGVQRKHEANDYIKQGYSKQLIYRRSDGSYPPYGQQGPSTWITAYVVKAFTMVYSLNSQNVNIDNICQSVKFLLLNKQSSDGSFTEANPAREQYKTGGLRGSDSTATLTAFVTIALAEVKQANISCSYTGASTETALNRAVPYLRGQLQKSPPPRPYTTAIISYALALIGDRSADLTSRLLAASSDSTYWPDADFLFSLEATGYALLALVKMEKLTEARKPYDYLCSHRNIGRGSSNTQSTMVLLNALSEYFLTQPHQAKRFLDIQLQISARRMYMHFNSETSNQLRSFNVPKDASIEVVAEGNGVGTMEVVTFYNQLPEVDANSCENFDLQVSIQKSTEPPPPGSISVFELSVSLMTLRQFPAVSVVLDITLPTGFTADTRDLQIQTAAVERFIDHFYFDDRLSDRSSLIIHLYKVSNTMPRIVSFRLLQHFKVAFLQPSSVTVHEYHREGQRCTRLYSPPLNQVQLITVCNNNVCRCAQDDCCEICRDFGNCRNVERESFACKYQHHVFKVKVLSLSSTYYDKYEVEITKVIKPGVEIQVMPSERRFFFSHTGCRNKCQLQIGSEYLIIGPTSDRWTLDTTTNNYMYILSRNTWVERWPTEAECTDPAFHAICQSLKQATERLNVEGCAA